MFERIDHVGIAVSEIEPALALYTEQFGATLVHREVLDADGVDAAMLRDGDARLELLAPLGPDTPLGRFLARRGPGVHHVAYEVDDLDAALATLRERAVALVDEQPRAGISGSRVAFLHPSSCAGVLTEIVQSAS
ncbi:MAG: methylmalonyl-CoA epimerase [Solirubrobacteraceae bacterium]|jgi:methylmalonyl-CoA epimerase